MLIKIIILSLAHGTRHKRCTFWHICCREMRIHSFILSVLLYLLLVQFYSIYELPILTIDVSPTLLGEAKHMISWLLGVYSICCSEVFCGMHCFRKEWNCEVLVALKFFVACIVSVRSETVKYFHIAFT